MLKWSGTIVVQSSTGHPSLPSSEQAESLSVMGFYLRETPLVS